MTSSNDPASTPLRPFRVLETRIDEQGLSAHILSARAMSMAGGLLCVTLRHEAAGEMDIQLVSDGDETSVLYSPCAPDPGPDESLPFITAVTLQTTRAHLAWVAQQVAGYTMIMLSPYIPDSEVALTLTPEPRKRPAWTRSPDAPLSN